MDALEWNPTGAWRKAVDRVAVRNLAGDDTSRPVPLIQRHQALLATASVVSESKRGGQGAFHVAARGYRVRDRVGTFVDIGNGTNRFLADPNAPDPTEATPRPADIGETLRAVREFSRAHAILQPWDALVPPSPSDADVVVNGIMAANADGLKVSIEEAGGTVMVTLWEWSGTRRRVERTGFATVKEGESVGPSTIARAFRDADQKAKTP